MLEDLAWTIQSRRSRPESHEPLLMAASMHVWLQVVSARKSVSVCLGREGGHWVANITFVNRLTTRSNEEVLATLNEALTSEDGLQFHKPDASSRSQARLSPIAPWRRIAPATYQMKAMVGLAPDRRTPQMWA